MFPLLDLDDDVIAATLGFTDPPSLCSATMTCRRLRRLADAAWPDLDKSLAPNKREGGSTPRERVLSSFIVHVEKERISRVVNNRIGEITDTSTLRYWWSRREVGFYFQDDSFGLIMKTRNIYDQGPTRPWYE